MPMGRNRISAIFRWLAALLAALCLIFFITSLASVDRQQGEEGRQQLETALRRCPLQPEALRAAEGVYPPTVEYLQQHYGVQIEEERYIVFYEIFANNLMPDITVLEKER